MFLDLIQFVSFYNFLSCSVCNTEKIDCLVVVGFFKKFGIFKSLKWWQEIKFYLLVKQTKNIEENTLGFSAEVERFFFFLFWTIDMFYFPPLVLKGASYAIIFQGFQNWGWQQNNTKILNKILHIVLLHLLFHNFKIITTFSRTFVMKWRLTVLLFHESYIMYWLSRCLVFIYLIIL